MSRFVEIFKGAAITLRLPSDCVLRKTPPSASIISVLQPMTCRPVSASSCKTVMFEVSLINYVADETPLMSRNANIFRERLFCELVIKDKKTGESRRSPLFSEMPVVWRKGGECNEQLDEFNVRSDTWLEEGNRADIRKNNSFVVSLSDEDLRRRFDNAKYLPYLEQDLNIKMGCFYPWKSIDSQNNYLAKLKATIEGENFISGGVRRIDSQFAGREEQQIERTRRAVAFIAGSDEMKSIAFEFEEMVNDLLLIHGDAKLWEKKLRFISDNGPMPDDLSDFRLFVDNARQRSLESLATFREVLTDAAESTGNKRRSELESICGVLLEFERFIETRPFGIALSSFHPLLRSLQDYLIQYSSLRYTDDACQSHAILSPSPIEPDPLISRRLLDPKFTSEAISGSSKFHASCYLVRDKMNWGENEFPPDFFWNLINSEFLNVEWGEKQLTRSPNCTAFVHSVLKEVCILETNIRPSNPDTRRLFSEVYEGIARIFGLEARFAEWATFGASLESRGLSQDGEKAVLRPTWKSMMIDGVEEDLMTLHMRSRALVGAGVGAQLNPSAVERALLDAKEELDQLAKKLEDRDKILRLPDVSILHFRYPESIYRSFFSLYGNLPDSIPPSKSVLDEVHELELENLYEKQAPYGITYPTGRDEIENLVINHGASLYCATRGDKIRGSLLVLEDQKKFPPHYAEILEEVKKRKVVGRYARYIFAVVMVVDNELRQELKRYNRRGYEEMDKRLWNSVMIEQVSRGARSDGTDPGEVYAIGYCCIEPVRNKAIDIHHAQGWVDIPGLYAYEGEAKYQAMIRRVL